MGTSEGQRHCRPRGKEIWADRIGEILDTAAVVFASHGYQKTEMKSIADALKMGKGTLYLYFPSKEELFLKAVNHGMQRMSQAVQQASGSVADPLERLTTAIHAYLSFFRKYPEYTELLIQERAQFKDAKKQTYFAHCETATARWRNQYIEMIAGGRVRDMPVDRILDVINDLVYGTMFTNYFSGRHKTLESQARDLVDIFFRGILSDAERQRRPDESANPGAIAVQAGT